MQHTESQLLASSSSCYAVTQPYHAAWSHGTVLHFLMAQPVFRAWLLCCACRRKGGVLSGAGAPGQAPQRCQPGQQPGWQLEAGAAAGQQGARPWGIPSLLQVVPCKLCWLKHLYKHRLLHRHCLSCGTDALSLSQTASQNLGACSKISTR